MMFRVDSNDELMYKLIDSINLITLRSTCSSLSGGTEAGHANKINYIINIERLQHHQSLISLSPSASFFILFILKIAHYVQR